MSVKVKDRHLSKQDCLYKARELVGYILVLTRPREFDKDGKQICKPGLLGEGQPLQAFGYDIIKCGKGIHACCYEACKINLKDKETLTKRNEYHNKAIEYCDSIFRQIDLCIYQYAQNSKKKRRSFEHLARLTKKVKESIQDRKIEINLQSSIDIRLLKPIGEVDNIFLRLSSVSFGPVTTTTRTTFAMSTTMDLRTTTTTTTATGWRRIRWSYHVAS